jgi:hypothetical protein
MKIEHGDAVAAVASDQLQCRWVDGNAVRDVAAASSRSAD